MKCEEIRDRLTEFLDEELPEDIYKIVQTHLDECEDCRKELESLKSVLSVCQQWKGIEPSRDWESELKKKLNKTQRPPEMEIEILRSAVIGLSQRVLKLEEKGALPPTLEGEIMTVEELARYLRLSVDKVFEIVNQIPKFRIGYEYRFVRESIDHWIRSLERNSDSQSIPYSDWNIEDYEK
jgi:excisionase family DNA binding protein